MLFNVVYFIIVIISDIKQYCMFNLNSYILPPSW